MSLVVQNLQSFCAFYKSDKFLSIIKRAHPAVETDGDVAELLAAEAEPSCVGERSPPPPLPIGAEVWWTEWCGWWAACGCEWWGTELCWGA